MTNIIPYTASPPFNSENLTALKDFSIRSERKEPLHFVGREDLLQITEAKLREARTDTKPDSDGIFLQGAPGAGKTAFLKHLRTRYQDDVVRVVHIEAEDLSNSLDFVSKFYDESHTPVHGGRVRNIGIRVGSALVQAGIRWETIEPSVMDQLGQGVSAWTIIGRLQPEDSSVVFLVCIDEAQRIERDPGSQRNKLAVNLNGANTGRLKVLPVFAGLSDVKSKLSDIGIFRGADRFIPLGALLQDECGEAIGAFFDNADFDLSQRVARANKERIIEALSVASEGWPRHLLCYMKALAQAIVQDQACDIPSGTIDLDAVLDHGHTLRIDYAEDRLDEANLGKFEEVLMDVTSQSPQHHLFLERLEGLANERGIAGADFAHHLDQAIHCGVLERESRRKGTRHVRFPVPSFRTFIMCRGDRQDTLESMREEMRRH